MCVRSEGRRRPLWVYDVWAQGRDREMMIEPVMWCQPQDAVGGRPED
nr:unknown [Zea mays]